MVYSNISTMDSLFKELKSKKDNDDFERNKKQLQNNLRKNKSNKDENKVIIEEIKKKDIDICNKSKCNYDNNDLSYMLYKLVIQFNVKVAILIFIFYILLNTDIFNKYALIYFGNNIYENNQITEKGLLVIGILLSLFYIIIDVLNQNGYI